MNNNDHGMSEATLVKLCGGRRRLLNYFPPTIFWTAEAYGLGKYIRKYGYYPRFLPLAIYTDHGVGHLDKKPCQHEIESYTPVMFYHDPASVRVWKRWSTKPCYVLYSPFVYYRRSNNIISDSDAAGTIVFPDHTAPSSEEVSDTQEYVDQLKRLPDKFQPISVCLHFQDIRIGRHKIYIRNNLPVYTAGDNFEHFAERFYAILKRFKFASANHIGTSLFYAVEMGIPFFLYGNKPVHINISDDNIPLGKVTYHAGCRFCMRIENMFTGLDDEITCEKKELVERTLGIIDGISRKEMAWVLYASLIKLFFMPEFYMDMGNRIRRIVGAART